MKRAFSDGLLSLREVCLVALALLTTGPPGQAQGGPTRTFTEWATPTPSAEPLHVVPLPNSRAILFTERVAGKIGRLNRTNNVIEEWTLPSGSFPHDIRILDSAIFFTDNGIASVSRLNPSTNVLTRWPLPSATQTTEHLVPVGISKLFFTDSSGAIGMLDTITNQLTEWPIPTANSVPNGIALRPTKVFFVEFGANKVGLLDPVSNTITEWAPPSTIQVSHIKVFEDMAFFCDNLSSIIGRLNPETNVVTEWTAPTPDARIADLAISPSGLVNFTESMGGNIGTLDASIQAGVDTVVTPVVTAISPVVTQLTPATSTLTHTTTVVTPVVTSVTGVVNGGFTEWAVPTLSAGPNGIKVLLDGGVAFTERGTTPGGLPSPISKVATLE